MPYPIFDSHAHYTSVQFDEDRAELLNSLPGEGVVGIIDCGTHYGSSLKAVELAHQYPFIWAAAGIHPESLIEEDATTVSRFGGDWKAEMAAMRDLYEDPRVVAVGEIGLDHHWPIPEDAQFELFEAQIRLALELDKPIIVHDRQAHAEVYTLLKKYKPKGVLHCYSGSADDAEWLVKQGMYIGFGGACTYKGANRAVKAVKAMPLDRILLETDCPYMAPEPCRGQRCDSGLIAHTGRFIAEVREMDVETLFTATAENARRLFLEK